jgi:hypothetical protein
MINLLGFIIELFVVHGHSLTKEVAPFSAKQAFTSKPLLHKSSDMATLTASTG